MRNLYKCEYCGGENYPEYMLDGLCMYCIEAAQDIEEESKYQKQIITKEMAMDAGEPELEGHEW